MLTKRLSKGHYKTKVLIEKRLGCEIPQSLIKPLFNLLDRGIKPLLDGERELAFILQAFNTIAYDFNSYIEDFPKGFLFLSDFEDEDIPAQQLALTAYKQSMGETTFYKGYKKRWLRNL